MDVEEEGVAAMDFPHENRLCHLLAEVGGTGVVVTVDESRLGAEEVVAVAIFMRPEVVVAAVAEGLKSVSREPHNRTTLLRHDPK